MGTTIKELVFGPGGGMINKRKNLKQFNSVALREVVYLKV